MGYRIQPQEESEWDVCIIAPDEFVLPDAEYRVPQKNEGDDEE